MRHLVEYLRTVHKAVDTHHARVRDEQQTDRYRQLGPGVALAIGDYVLVKREPQKEVSQRFQGRHFDEPFQVVEVHGSGVDNKVYTLANLTGEREGLGFSQPVALERLTPIEMLPLAQVSENEYTRIRLDLPGGPRDGSVTNQSIDGKVYIRFDGETKDQCVDLAASKYHWL